MGGGTGHVEEVILSLEHVERFRRVLYIHTYTPKNKYLYCVMDLQCIG